MKNVKQRRPEKEDHLRAALDFAAVLHKSLISDHQPRGLPTDLSTDLYKHIDTISLEQYPSPTWNFKDIDECGTKLWNVSSKLNKDGSTSAQLVCLVRVFACLLLDCAQRLASEIAHNVIRILKSTLKTAKLCLDHGHVMLAERMVEKAAYYEDVLAQPSQKRQEDSATYDRVTREYYIIRIALAWKQDRLDLAQITLTKLGSKNIDLDPILTESLADLLFEIGKDQIKRSKHDTAVLWLEKADDLLSSHGLEDLSGDAEELQAAITHSLAQALISLPGEDGRKKASNLLNNINTRKSDRLAVQLLKLDLLSTESTFPSEDYYNVILSIVRMVHITDSNMKTIMHHVHKLRLGSPSLAHRLLQTLLSERLNDTEKPDWAEKVLITLIWNLTTSTDLVDDTSFVQQLLLELQGGLVEPVRASATHAAHMLLWKKIETCYNMKNYSDAATWCHLALHETFVASGDLNKGKLQRKLVLVYLALSDLANALDLYHSMSDSNKHSQETKYLMYKVALRLQDSELASECFESIYRGSTTDASLLYACVLEAQQAGNKDQAVATMQRVLNKFDYGVPPGVHLPALLRCTARLLMHDVHESSTRDESVIDSICKIFEAAAVQAKTLKKDPAHNPFLLAELDWFSRNSYNLTLKSCTTWDPQQTWRVLQTCVKFIDLYPPDMDANALADLALRHMFCDFLGGSLLVVMARAEDHVANQLQRYIGVRKHAYDFHTQLRKQLDNLEGGAKADLLSKSSILLVFDFEAVVRLKAWQDIDSVIDGCQECAGPKTYENLADLILSSEAPVTTIMTTLQIINSSWEQEGNDLSKVSRWIRCLFQLALTSKAEIAMHLLAQVTTIAENAEKESRAYPPEELEWIATTTFNRAVDFYCASQDAECKMWAEKALSIAHMAHDGGSLHRTLESKYLGLQWES